MRRYGTRDFTRGHMLMLQAVLTHHVHDSPDILERLRVLRNVIEASENELRPDAMPALVAAVDAYIRTGVIGELRGFNANQITQEQVKRDFVESHPQLRPELLALEGMVLLRGGLAVELQ